MPTATTRSIVLAPLAQPVPTLHLALDLGNTTWKLAFATSHAHAPRLRTIPARDLAHLTAEIAAAKARFGLAADAPVVSCYEAGRDGFWVHRALVALGVANHVVDSASIQQNRRKRRPKSDRLDAAARRFGRLRSEDGRRAVRRVRGRSLRGRGRRTGKEKRDDRERANDAPQNATRGKLANR